MQSLHGEFSIHRTRTEDGRDAILLVPECPGLRVFTVEHGETYCADISFEKPEHLTLTRAHHSKLHLGPYVPRKEAIQ